MENAQTTLNNIIGNIEKVIIGKHSAVELIVTAMTAAGHVLIEDIPGVGKTSLVQALARSVDCGFSRIQFNPDTMPSDITGFSVYNPKSGEFEFRPGAAQSNFILADEINRATPKTQSSLLEIMEERQITVDGKTHPLGEPFMVLATQNPVEYLGTYPLPEAQIDRFMIRVSLGYPGPEQEAEIIARDLSSERDALRPVAGAEDILELKKTAEKIYVEKSVRKYIIDLIGATRSHRDILLGASPRGSISVFRMCRALALCRGRDYVMPDDVKYIAPFVLSHRLILTQDARMARKSTASVIHEILGRVPVPAAG